MGRSGRAALLAGRVPGLPSPRTPRLGPAQRGGLVAVGFLTALGASWEVQRRRDLRAIEADPEQQVLGSPPEGRSVRVRADDGTGLHAEVFGPDDAPTIVFVHGWTCSLRFWAYQLAALSESHRLVAYDLRGHGRSERAGSRDYSTDAYAGDLDAVLRELVPADERATLVGHSLGAMTILAWAARNPDAVEQRCGSAALVNTGTGDLISESLIVSLPRGLDLARKLVGRIALGLPAPLPSQSTPLASRLVRHVALSPSASPAQVAFTESMVLEARPTVRARTGASLSRLDLAEAIESLTVPTLVIAGACDRLTPPIHAKGLFEALPRPTDLIEIPDVGHMAPLEGHDDVTEHIRTLVAHHARATGQASG
ncbi:MAG: alpha/beta fold hydrolase [Solirubrobacteraceae bacterium]